MEILFTFARWAERRWRNANWAVRSLYVALLIAIVVAIIILTHELPAFNVFKDLFAHAHPTAQFGILVVALAVIFVLMLFALMRHNRTSELKDEKEGLKRRLEAVEAENRQHQARWDQLLAADHQVGLWRRPCQVVPPDFVPASQRTTRFLTVLNFKGGVGKTTLTANLAAGLALAVPAKRVLLIDIDFQGTLSDATVENALREVQTQNGNFVNRLFFEASPDANLVQQLAVSMHGVPAVKVILANDTLEAVEYNAQARFFVDPAHEARYHFRKHLHRTELFQAYDVVIFDCPPRVTASVVNALACSDSILIPTRLDLGSINAVPRTLGWIRSLGAHCPGDVIGVVASHVAVRMGKPIKADFDNLGVLRNRVAVEYGNDIVFDSYIPSTSKAIGPDTAMVASLTAEGRNVFAPFVAEIRRRMKL